jgi:hypothetical protein
MRRHYSTPTRPDLPSAAKVNNQEDRGSPLEASAVFSLPPPQSAATWFDRNLVGALLRNVLGFSPTCGPSAIRCPRPDMAKTRDPGWGHIDRRHIHRRRIDPKNRGIRSRRQRVGISLVPVT